MFNVRAVGYTTHIQTIILFLPTATQHSVVDVHDSVLANSRTQNAFSCFVNGINGSEKRQKMALLDLERDKNRINIRKLNEFNF